MTLQRWLRRQLKGKPSPKPNQPWLALSLFTGIGAVFGLLYVLYLNITDPATVNGVTVLGFHFAYFWLSIAFDVAGTFMSVTRFRWLLPYRAAGGFLVGIGIAFLIPGLTGW